MTGATMIRPGERESDAYEQRMLEQDLVPLWDLESSPRLYESDLTEPEGFHRRLVDWIMRQK